MSTHLGLPARVALFVGAIAALCALIVLAGWESWNHIGALLGRLTADGLEGFHLADHCQAGDAAAARIEALAVAERREKPDQFGIPVGGEAEPAGRPEASVCV